MPQKGQVKRRNYQNDIKITAVSKIYEAETMETNSETEVDTSAFNSSIHSEASDNDVEMSEKSSEIDEDQQNLSDFVKFELTSAEKAVIGMVHESKFYFKGKISIKVLKGRLEILGTILTSQSQEFFSVYSPKGYSLLYCQGFRADSETDSLERLESEDINCKDVSSSDCVFIAKKLEETWCDFLTDHLKKSGNKINLFRRDPVLKKYSPPAVQEERERETLKNAFSKLEETLDVNIFPSNSTFARLFEVGDSWDLAVQSAEWSLNNSLVPRIVLAGGKGVGKSTYLRWLANRLLARSPVVVLDLDPGQAELSIPGYFSVSLVTTPFLGPNFKHIGTSQTQLLVCLGDNNVGSCPDRFIKILHRLSDYIKTHLSDYPLLVNTMGWCSGVGLMLLVDTIRLLQPTTVVQLHSKYQRKNFPYSLTPETVGSCRDSWRSSRTRLNYNLLELMAVPESSTAKDMRSKDNWGLPEPRMLRDLVMLSWLGRTGWPWPVYTIPLASLTLGVIKDKVPPVALLASINNSLVDLCHVKEHQIRRPADRPELYSVLARSVHKPSLGVGFVRNIDMEKAVLHLATYLQPGQLADVNCLLVGQLHLPSSVLSGSGKSKHSPPYLGKETNNPLDATWQRYHKPR